MKNHNTYRAMLECFRHIKLMPYGFEYYKSNKQQHKVQRVPSNQENRSNISLKMGKQKHCNNSKLRIKVSCTVRLREPGAWASTASKWGRPVWLVAWAKPDPYYLMRVIILTTLAQKQKLPQKCNKFIETKNSNHQ
jgi:hypothetical protein